MSLSWPVLQIDWLGNQSIKLFDWLGNQSLNYFPLFLHQRNAMCTQKFSGFPIPSMIIQNLVCATLDTYTLITRTKPYI